MSETETTGKSRVDEADEDTSEAQAQVIASLRAQVTDLFSQVTQLNSKLVTSYDRVSNLEDELHDTSASLRNANVTVSSLELERSHHLAALNTGLLVEKAHVTTELNRLMERATEEAAQRGQAESARHDIEKDLDDLSATLFDQANTMVAEARLGQARSERKVHGAEEALKMAEDAVKQMQVQMQTLQADKEDAERQAREARMTMGKGKWVERDELRVGEVPRIRFMTTHTPYSEFIAFVTHLRGLRVQQPTPPAMSMLLGQPFLARLLTEDSEPTLRLDLAPSLNWLSRRSVLAAIHTGMLTVEPISFTNLLQEFHSHSSSVSSTSVSCALCGTEIARLPPGTLPTRPNSVNGSSWFKYPLALSSSSQNSTATTPQTADFEPPGQVYIFRLAAATTAIPPPYLNPVHAPSASMPAVGTSTRPPMHPVSATRVLPPQTQNSPYPLCTSNYCLTRLRSTCSLWAFVRVGVVERIWEEEVIQPPKSGVDGNSQETLGSPVTPASAGSQPASATAPPTASEKPPVPPRRRRLWEMASALGERAVSWGKEGGDSVKEKGGAKEKESTKTLLPPPTHPTVPHPHTEVPTPREQEHVPPPLPKRSVVRGRATTDTAVPPPETHQNGTAAPAPEPAEPAVTTNGHLETEKVDPNASNDSFATPVDEITFAAPTPTATSPAPFTTTHPVPADATVSAAPIQDQPTSPAAHNIPLPETPTSPIPPRVTSPIPRPRSRVSSPASPPPISRAASPAIKGSRPGSPAPAGITRTTTPPPGHLPTPSHIRGKLSTSSPLGPSRPASPAAGPGAPPLPRRAPARRAVPPPPTTSSDGKVGGEVARDEVKGTVPATEPAPETEARKEEVESEKEKEKEAVKREDNPANDEASVELTAAPVTDVAAAAAPAPESIADGTKGEAVADDVQPSVESQLPPTVAAPDAPPSADTDAPVPSTENNKTSTTTVRTSIDTTSTKRSSSTEGEGFAGDATWEERTWKEVVRLKEEMFWARIGGVRALGG